MVHSARMKKADLLSCYANRNRGVRVEFSVLGFVFLTPRTFGQTLVLLEAIRSQVKAGLDQ